MAASHPFPPRATDAHVAGVGDARRDGTRRDARVAPERNVAATKRNAQASSWPGPSMRTSASGSAGERRRSAGGSVVGTSARSEVVRRRTGLSVERRRWRTAMSGTAALSGSPVTNFARGERARTTTIVLSFSMLLFWIWLLIFFPDIRQKRLG